MKTWTHCFMLAAAISTVGGVAVAGSLQGMMSNTFIEDSIQGKLAADLVLKGSSIQVAVADGLVTLTGCATSLKASNKAAKIARSTANVKSVTNRLRTRC